MSDQPTRNPPGTPGRPWPIKPPSHLNPERMKIGGPKVKAIGNVGPFVARSSIHGAMGGRRSAKKVRELALALQYAAYAGGDRALGHSADYPKRGGYYEKRTSSVPSLPSWRLEEQEPLPKGVLLLDHRPKSPDSCPGAAESRSTTNRALLAHLSVHGPYTAAHILTDYERMYPMDSRAKFVGLDHPELAQPRPRSWWRRASIVRVRKPQVDVEGESQEQALPEPVQDWPPR